MLRLLRSTRRLPLRTYAIVVAAVLGAYLARVLLEPLLQANHPYLLFYPVVMVAAYVFGRGPAILAAVLSASLAFWRFAEPAFGVSVGAATLTPLLLFAITSCVAIFLLTDLKTTLRRVAADQGRLQALADAHAGLFRDLQGRIGHHMNLVAGVLSFQAKGEPDPEVLALLRRAGERSQLISLAQRQMSGGGAAHVDFGDFSRALARASCLEAGLSPDHVTIAGEGVVVPAEVATSLGVALVECLGWILKRGSSDRLAVRIETAGGRLSVAINHNGTLRDADPAMASSAYLFRAMVEQLGAQVALSVDEHDASELELSVPLAPYAERPGRGVTLH